MWIKPSVNLAGARPEIAIAISLLGLLCLERGLKFTITSLSDGKHSRGSLHYVGQAFDIRTKDWTTEETDWVVEAAKQRLGPQFDVIIEADHIHVEFQPKQNS